MKQFLTRSLFFIIPVLAGFIGVAYMADGYTDPFYLRFTSPRQNALIVGSSRAAQGLQPAVLNATLSGGYRHPLYNFSFTSTYSPMGPTYFNAIRKKLNPDIKNSVFIVAVDVWSLTADKKMPEDSTAFQENNLMLGHNPWINGFPCYTYLARDYPMPYLTLLTGKVHRNLLHAKQNFLLHEDGWLEVSNPMDSANVGSRTRNFLY
ncbi:MAG: hypothetical protein JST39_16875, partial [Bacteroidetes bacterium]|nr:hypothetical protein [Bacteroidota bacterium]